MKTDTLFSVIIPTYNYAQYICRCIGSVLTCGGKELEVIVVDDGSTDDTAARVKDLSESDKRIRYVYQDNTGVSAARNYGINLARGKWVFFVDGDDVVDAEMIRMLIPEDSTIQIIGAMMLENDNGEVLRANSFDHVQGYPEITFFKSLTGEFYMPQRCSSLPVPGHITPKLYAGTTSALTSVSHMARICCSISNTCGILA